MKDSKDMNPTDALRTGLTGTISMAVTPDKTAARVGSGSVEVFATPMLVSVMEAAACAAIDTHLPDTHTSLGLKIDVVHSSPTPLGFTVTAVAELVEISERKLNFTITARDEQEVIGTSTHTRVVVDRAKFEQKLRTKTIA